MATEDYLADREGFPSPGPMWQHTSNAPEGGPLGILRTAVRVLVNKLQAATLPKILEQERPSLVQLFIWKK